MTKQNVREAAAGRWLEILTQCGLDASLLVNRHGPCPGCGGKDRFRFDDLGRNGTFVCSQGGGGLLVGDGFRLLEHAKGWDWRRAIAEVARILGIEHGAIEYRERQKDAVVPAPMPEKPQLQLDMAAVTKFVHGVPAIAAEWLWRRSAIDPRGVSSGAFLDALYEPGERVLVFTDHRTQGDFVVWKKTESGKTETLSYRLSQTRGVQARRSELPAGGPQGVWFLTQPVTGQWMINPKTADDQRRWTRRSECNVTAWRYFVLESDELPPELWLRVLVSLALPIAAIYTSGGRSIHALVRLDVPSKAVWDATRRALQEIACPRGADPAALTAVRLSRLPGCKRGNKMQELLYLAPDPAEHTPIRALPEVRQ